ncbi:MAG: HD domain-containing phosphohydrolase [Aminivibrio sp.]|jgi:PAS domain S-box-containing protein/putative nucleotidyltransferase with HDIG domain
MKIRTWPAVKLTLLLLLLSATFCPAMARSRPELPVSRVVMLHSLSPEDRWTGQVTDAVLSVLTERGAEAEVFIEFMDAAGSFAPSGGESFKRLMTAKYGPLPPSLVITSGTEAFDFASGEGGKAFGNPLIVFCALAEEHPAAGIKSRRATGISSPSSRAYLLAEVGRLHPKAPVFFLTRYSPSGMRDFSKLITRSGFTSDEAKLLIARDYQPDTLKELLHDLPENSVIILGSHSSATEEGEKMTKDVLSFISRISPFPLYSLDEWGASHGATGSLRKRGTEMGRRAGEMAADFLAGKPVGEIEPESAAASTMIFNHQEMKRRSIPRSSLPEGALVLRDPMQTIREHIPAAALYGGVSALLAALVFFMNRRVKNRRKTEKKLEKTTENWKQLFQNLPEGIAIYDSSGRILETNHTFLSIFALSREETEGRKIQEILPWDKGTLEPEDFFTDGRGTSREVVIPDRDSNLFDGTHLPFLIAEEPQLLYCSLVKDISERKRTSDLLRQKRRYQQSVASISSRFLLTPFYREAMESSLEEIMAFSGAKSGIIYRYCEETRLLIAEAEVLARPENPSLRKLFPSAPDEALLWEGAVLADRSYKPVTFSLERYHDSKNSPWRPLAEAGVSFVSILPLVTLKEALGIMVLADPPDSWRQEGLGTAFHVLSNSLAAAIEHYRDENALEENRRIIGDRFTGIIMALCQVSELKDISTAGHQKNVSALAEILAAKLGLPKDRILSIKYAGLVHDIGKLYIPAEILSKPSALSAAEYSLIKEHPQYGSDILSPMDFPWPLAEIILQHHERMDGEGYPRGLAGDEIRIEARILSVADSFDAMTSDRPYRERMPAERAMAEIRLLTGKAYDPDVVRVLEEYLGEKGAIGEKAQGAPSSRAP